MSFYRDNKYYIKQNLQVGMKGLSLEKKKSKYNFISSDVRKRINQSYPKKNNDSEEINNIEFNIFYKELFEFVGEFELNYIIANLFFESNFTNITHYLRRNSRTFQDLIIPPFEQFSFKWMMFMYLKEEDFFQSTFIEFLIELICTYTNLSKKDLQVNIRKGKAVFEFVHKYPEWLINNLIEWEDFNKIVLIHLMIIKLFNLNEIFTRHEERNKFAILFLHKTSECFNNKIKNGEIPRLSLFHSKMNGIIDSFFIKDQISKTPILDASENEYYTDGFYLKRKTFLKYVEQAEILNKNLLIESYDYLFCVYFSSGNLAKEKISKAIISKIKDYQVPSCEEVKNLNQFSHETNYPEITKLVSKHLYFFENHKIL